MSDERVQIWRCTKCGRWSHAKRKPSWHLRTVWEGQPEYDPTKGYGAVYDHMNGFTEADSHGIQCGPFEPYVAAPGRLP